jgi:hypothetical protein
MPRYYFNIHDGKDIFDDTGTELPDDDRAKTEAVRLAGGLLKDLGSDFWTGSDWLLRVLTEDGRNVCELTFSAKS